MKSKRNRIGSKNWKKSGHKTREWYINQYGKSGIAMWEKRGK